MKIITEISLVYLILNTFIAFGLTWYFYIHKNKWSDLDKKIRISIYCIRFFVLFIIGILFLGIFVENKNLKEEKPILITIIDNSSSILNYKDSLNVKKEIPKFIESINKLGDKFEKRFYTIGSEFKTGNNLDFKDSKSNFSEPFEAIFSDYYNRNIGAILFVSDGNFNEGQNPIYNASKIPFTPIFTIGVGDTIQKFDQLLNDVIYNEVAFLNNKFPIQVNLECSKMKNKKAKLNLYQNGQKIASQSFTPNSNQFQQEINFEVEAKNVGFQQFYAEIETIEGEYTSKNNAKRFYIEILDARNKILLLSGAPHPDISALKSVFEQDKNIQVESKTIDTWDRNLKNTDLVIWHEPGILFKEEINALFKKTNTPILYFIGVNTTQNVIQKLNVGLEYTNTNQQDEVQATFNSGFDLFEISEELKNEIAKFSPLITKFGTPRLSSQNQVFLKQKLANIQKNEALAFFGNTNGNKYGVILGDGIWRWKMDNYLKAKNYQLFTDLFTKINQFLVQKQNTSNLRVSLPKKFLKGENILIKAEFYNEAMDLITKPVIGFNLVDAKGKKSELEFGVNNQNYLLQLGKLNPGLYNWTALTSYNGKKYTKKGTFVVEDILIEKLDTRANHALLIQLANNSKGKFYNINNTDNLLKEINKREEITTISYEESSIENVLDFIWLFFFLILLLTSEWFLKRWNGFY